MLSKKIVCSAVFVSCVNYISCLSFNVANKDLILRHKREVTETTTRDPDTETTPSDVYLDNQSFHSNTQRDSGDIGHLQGDIGHGSATEGHGQGHTSFSSDFHGDTSYHGAEYGSYSDTHGSEGHIKHTTEEPGTDYQNPLYMTRPGEAPPRFMSNVQDNPAESMPRALPLIQEGQGSDTAVDSGYSGPPEFAQPAERAGDPTMEPTNMETSKDTPRALPQTQDYGSEVGRQPIALPQRQGTTGTKSRPTSAPVQKRPSQGQRSRLQPRQRPREPNQQAGGSGGDILAAAAILNSDVRDTVVDGMEMVAKQQAMDHLGRQLSGSTRSRQGVERQRIPGGSRTDTRGRAGPQWGGTEQSSAPRRRGGRGGSQPDPLDTLAQVHNMKTQADLVQDHVDTVHDIHQDQTDYMYGRRDYDPRYNHGYDRYHYRDHNNRGGRFPQDQNFETGQRGTGYRGYDSYPPYQPYYRDRGDRHYDRGEENYYHGYEGYQPRYKLDINTGLPCTNMSDPRCQGQGYGEVQIETPHGEVDMEPGELDLEGPAAADLLRMLGFARNPRTPPGQQEININHNVLAALQSQFGINSTADIRRMSSNRDFQAFMYQVLTLSGEIAPGEYNANLTKVQVDRLLANHDNTRPRPRLRTANLDHAKLVIDTPRGGSNNINQSEAVLTIDGGAGANNGNLGLGLPVPILGNLPGIASPLVQNGQLGQTREVAQPGSVAALIQTVLGGGPQAGEEMGGGEPGEGREGGKQINGTQTGEMAEVKEGTETSGNVTTASKELSKPTAEKNLNSSSTVKINGPQKQTGAETLRENNTTQTSLTVKPNTVANAAQLSQNSSVQHEADVVGKDTNPKLSKDSMAKVNKASSVNTTSESGSNINMGGVVAETGTGSQSAKGAGAGTGNTAAGAGTGTGAADTAGTGSGHGKTGSPGAAGSDIQPIGLAEAGIDPGAQVVSTTNAIPTEAIDRGYKASTAFAIASVTLIALAIIVGPILCLLCKMKEKADQQKRKQKAMKNRDVSENNIMEAMMLHDFGPEAPNFVANEAAAAANYYTTDREYSTLDHDIYEIESLKPGRPGPDGHLP